MFAKLLMRDLAILVATLMGWHAYGQMTDPHSTAGVAAAVAVGVATVICGFLGHEWGHLLGALARGGRVDLPTGLFASVFLFQFDLKRNTREQFLAMSMGGFIASALIVALLLVILPFDTLAARVALVLTSLGVLATFVIEIPGAWRVYRTPSVTTDVSPSR
jgi:hypothetical protein